MLIEKSKNRIRKSALLCHGDRVVVAVSGGPDSVCLLNVLQTLAPEHGLQLHVAHLDHRFRGAGSEADAGFVRRLAATAGLPATIESFDVPAYCRERGLSSQAGAREVRYAFLERVADTFGAERIAVGHTANDQAETVLMRLLRGAGRSGLAGIPPVRGRIIRPLIDATRDEVLAFLRERSLDHVTDPSNESPDYTRNRIRTEILPALSRFNPRVVETLAMEAALLRDEEEMLEAQAAQHYAQLVTGSAGTVRIGRAGFLELPAAVRRRLLRAAAAAVAGGRMDLSAVQTEEALTFLDNARSGRQMALLSGMVIEREYDAFVLRPRTGPFELSAALSVPGETSIPEIALVIRTDLLDAGDPRVAGEGNYLWQAVFDYDKIASPLVLRSRRQGDRISPAGMKSGSKKLQDLFTDEKVPRSARDRVPVLAAGQDVLWVVGMRTDGRFLPAPATKRILVVSVQTRDVHQEE